MCTSTICSIHVELCLLFTVSHITSSENLTNSVFEYAAEIANRNPPNTQYVKQLGLSYHILLVLEMLNAIVNGFNEEEKRCS